MRLRFQRITLNTVKFLGVTLALLGVGTGCIQPSGSKGEGSPPGRPQNGPTVVYLNLTSADLPTYNYGNLIQTVSATHTFTISNSNATGTILNFSAVVTGTSYSFPGGFPGTGGTCTSLQSLAPGQSCDLVVKFLPATSATFAGELIVTYSGSTFRSRQLVIDLQGVGVPVGSMVVTPGSTNVLTPYDFGSTPLSTSPTTVFTVSNPTSVTTTAVAYSTTSAGAGGTFSITANTCGVTLAPSATCNVTVQFAAAAAPASATGTLHIAYNDGTAVVSVDYQLKGTAVNLADHLSLATSPGTEPSAVAHVGTPFTVKVAALDSGGVFASYYSGTVRLDAIALSPDFGVAVGAVIPTLFGAASPTATMTGGIATFTLNPSTAALVVLRPTMTASTYALPAGANVDSTAVAIDLLRSTSGLYTTSLLAYLPFDSNITMTTGTGNATFTPGFGFRMGPWVSADADPTVAATFSEAFFRDAVVLSENSSLKYLVGSQTDPRFTGKVDNFDLNRGTVALWLKTGWPGNDATPRRIFMASPTGGPVIKTGGDSRLYAGLRGVGENDFAAISTSSWTSGSWHHMVYRWDRSNPIYYSGSTPVYSAFTVDGTTYAGKTSSWNAASVSPTTDQIYVGTGSSGTDYSAGGVLAGVRMDDRVWSSSEVSLAYTGGTTGGTTGVHDFMDPSTKFNLTGHLGSLAGARPFQGAETQLTTAMSNTTAMSVANGSNFTAGDTVWIVGAGALHLDGTAGTKISLGSVMPGNADTGGSHVSMDVSASSFTIEAWIRTNTANVAGSEQTILRKMDTCSSSGTGGYKFVVNTSGYLSGTVCTSTGTKVVGTGTTKINNGVWHHVAMVVDQTGSKLYLYVDGSEQYNGSISGVSTINPSISTAYIGGSPSGAETFSGDIDQVRFWTIAVPIVGANPNLLTSRARSQTYNCSAGLLFEFGFDDAVGSTSFADNCGAANSTGTGGISQIGDGATDFSHAEVGYNGATYNGLRRVLAAATSSTLTSGAALTKTYANAQVYKVGSGVVPYNNAPGGDMETLGAFFPTGNDPGDGYYHSSAMWYDISTSGLSGKRSLHVTSDNICTSAQGFYCPDMNYGGIYTDASIGSNPGGYLVSFDYKLVNGTMYFAVGKGGDAAWGGASNLIPELISQGLTSTTSAHYETAYTNQNTTTNFVYFLGKTSTTEFLLDNVKVIPTLLGADFENAALPAGWAMNGCASAQSVTYHTGTYSSRISGCGAIGNGITTNTATTQSGHWYVASAWVSLSAGGATMTVNDVTLGAPIGSTQVLSTDAGQFVRVSIPFQASSNQSNIVFGATSLASDILIDDVALYEIESINLNSALAPGATTYTTTAMAGAVAAGTCNSVYSVGTQPAGRVTCGAMTSGGSTALGPGTSCSSSARLNTACTNGTTPSGGTTDGALIVDGSSSMTIPTVANISHTSFTLSMWVKARKALNTSGYDFYQNMPPIFGIGTYASGDNLSVWDLTVAGPIGGLQSLMCATGGGCMINATNPTTGWDSTSTTNQTLPQGTWQHIAVTYSTGAPNAGVLYTYNNAQTATRASSAVTTFATGFTGNINIGGFDGTIAYFPNNAAPSTNVPGLKYTFENFDGWVDNVRTFNRPLNSDELIGICTTEKPSSWSGTCGP